MVLSTNAELTGDRTVWVDALRQQLLRGSTARVTGIPFLVRRSRLEVSQNASSYVKCDLGDQTGWIDAIWWDVGKMGHAELQSLLAAPAWVVDGAASINRFGARETPQIKIDRAWAVDGVDPLGVPGLVRRSSLSEAELGLWCSDAIAGIQNTPLKLLLEDTLGDDGCWRPEYLRVPAGLHYHHAYLGGLADHVREMAQVWLSSATTFPKVDRDLTLGGILLHDVGKLDTFSPGTVPQIAQSGRYMDHITAGIGRLTRAMDAMQGFPPLLRDHLLHIVASHHGEKEHGSPIVPATREAIVVHHLDRMSSLLSHLEEWTRQSGVDQFGWSTDASPWIKTSLALSPTIPDEFIPSDGPA